MNADFERRMQAIAENIRDIESERRRREPLLFFEPWSIVKGEIETILYEDQTKDSVARNMISIDSALKAGKCAINNGIAIRINMGNCIEWLHVRYMKDSAYTAEQKARFKQEDQKRFSEIKWLYLHKEGSDLMKVLAEIPQDMRWKHK